MAVSENPLQKKLASQSINYWKILRIFLSRWYWVAATLVISYVLAFFTIRSTPPQYVQQATLKLDNTDQLMNAGNPAAYRYYKPNAIQSEAPIMKSEEVVMKAIKTLDYKVSYFLEGRLRTSELYPNIPFKVGIVRQDTMNFSRALYHVKPVTKNTYSISSSDNPKSTTTHSYGELLEKGNMVFTILSPVPQRGDYSFRFNSARDFYPRAAYGLNVSEQEKYSNIMLVTHTDGNPYFSTDILNAVIRQYVINDGELKKRSAVQTIEYLDSQIAFLDSAVNRSGDKLSNFQTSNNVIDPQTDKQMSTSRITELQTKLEEAQLRELSIREVENQVKNNRENQLLDINLEQIQNGAITSGVSEYNRLIAERNLKLKEWQPGSKPIAELDRQLETVKRSLINNVNLLYTGNRQNMRYIAGQLGTVNQTLNRIPKNQNDFTKLQNNLDANQRLFSMLFERKLTAQISRAAVIPSATIIDPAQTNSVQISPREDAIYSSYLFMGLLAGIGLIILVRIINPYIYDVETVEGLTTTPIIGVILKYPKKIDRSISQILSLEKPKSVFAESVRSVRTNLSFLASQKKTKVICVTSEISGEGKSFVTVNLAGTLAIIEKKVIVVAADLRRSKLHHTFGSDNKIGLSTFLSSKNTIQEIIGHDTDHNIDYITSGPVPPNPSELLHSNLIDELIDTLKETYEYIIFDTAPVGLVSDSIPLIRKADINLFIIRSGVSHFKAASIPERLSKEYSLDNIAIILNSFGNEKLHANIYSTNYIHGSAGAYYYSDYTGYGNSGYYDDEDRNKWWNFWKRWIKKR